MAYSQWEVCHASANDSFAPEHLSTYQRLIRLSKEGERDGAYRVSKRLQAVVLNSQGRSSGESAAILQAPRSKVSEWLARYETHGVEGLLEGQRCGRPPQLSSAHRQALRDILDSGPVAYGLETGIWTSLAFVRPSTSTSRSTITPPTNAPRCAPGWRSVLASICITPRPARRS
jgi:hypothetical protein